LLTSKDVTILDIEDKSEELQEYTEKGVKFQVTKITKLNVKSVLDQYLKTGDLLIDLAYEIDTLTLLIWCHENGVLYVNASVEEWDPYGKYSTYEETLYYRHMRIREVTDKWISAGKL
jgi:homospermidine synthase